MVVVVDASGSMWGQIDGRTKIEWLREAFASLASDLEPETTALGLMAYGHRREGDCSDIEMIAAPGSQTPGQLVTAVNGLTPRGRTPMGEAVRQAAESLRYRDVPASVVLLSDGVETCGVDLCALGAELEASGVDFTAHVIGFDLTESESAGLQCLAGETGGQYYAVSGGADLSGALSGALSASLFYGISVFDAETRLGVDGPVRYRVTAPDGSVEEITDEDGVWEVELETGSQIAISVEGYEPKTLTLTRSRDAVQVYLDPAEQSLTLDFPASVPAAEMLPLGWSEAPQEADWLVITSRGAAWTEYRRIMRFDSEAAAELPAPSAAGEYDVVYLRDIGAGNTQELARQPLDVAPARFTLEAPERAPASTVLELAFSGPQAVDSHLRLVPAGGEPGAYLTLAYLQGEASPVALETPAEPGAYEILYVLEPYGDAVVIDRRPLSVE